MPLDVGFSGTQSATSVLCVNGLSGFAKRMVSLVMGLGAIDLPGQRNRLFGISDLCLGNGFTRNICFKKQKYNNNHLGI